MRVGDVCTRGVVTVSADAAVLDVARLMRDRHVGDVVVIGGDRESTRPIGILTDRDIVVGIVAQAPDKIAALRVGDVMSDQLVTAATEDTVDDALGVMRDRGIRRLPVVDSEGHLAGIITFDDVIEVMAQKLNDLVSVMARERRYEQVRV